MGFCVTFEVRSQIKYKNPLFLVHSPGKAGFLHLFCGCIPSISPILLDYNRESDILGDFAVLHILVVI